jgi:large subunit ribosomal protein L10
MSQIRAEKKSIVKEIQTKLESSKYVVLVGYSGLTVEALSDLRKKLSGAKSKLTVTTNAFLRKVLESLGWKGLEEFLGGSVAVVTGTGDVAQVAKILDLFSTSNSFLVLKGGSMEGRLITSNDVGAMAKLPPRPVLLAKLVGTIAAPLAGVVGVMNQKVCSLLYALKAIEGKKQG